MPDKERGEAMRNDHQEDGAAIQRARLLEALEQGPVSTLYAREYLDILHPAARVQELREQGYNVTTEWVLEDNGEGRPHRVAKYVLLPAGPALQGDLFKDGDSPRPPIKSPADCANNQTGPLPQTSETQDSTTPPPRLGCAHAAVLASVALARAFGATNANRGAHG